eukprot:TRINITY_DN3156_c0_g1_i1.p1 TRINITY_DN3156_c0_g1~~TRINITY_DN3156_c0_g1_i1.p1  ORF type:complete len:471 (-),score=148.73 TRINITY_DN3156_c0_g1_i1:132-1544(-)
MQRGSLAEEFLADLGEDEEVETKTEVPEAEEGDQNMIIDDESGYTDIKDCLDFVYGDRLRGILEEVDEGLSREPERVKKIAGVEDSDYALVIRANGMAVEIAEEITKISRFIKEKYKKKFPELETLVLNPIDYARVVQKIGNQMDISDLDLTDVLPAATVMVVTVTATTSAGEPLDASELETINKACGLTMTLEEARKRILEYVESRMTVIAPNLSILVGSSVAAKLLGAVGGLINLSKLPSSSVQSLGSTRRHTGGLSTASVKQYHGFIWESEVMLKCPPSIRSKAARVLGTKLVLAARSDAYNEDPTGSSGSDLKEIILNKIEKWQEPPPIRLPKPLPAPDDRPKKRRGGARMRQIKQKFAMTELRKQANRVNFGTEEQESYRNSSKTLGMIGTTSGKVRLSAVDKGILKKQKQKAFGGSTVASGLTSSLAFTPIQGLELSNPDAAKKVKQANEKYFGVSTFAQVGKK